MATASPDEADDVVRQPPRAPTTVEDDGQSEELTTVRLEALSDGVFAVAITLLALELTVPAVREGKAGYLLALLGREWPSYLAYALSFLSILIMWLNHHTVFRLIKRTDHALLLINGLLLMVITAIPFATSLLAEYLIAPDDIVDVKVAEGVYSGLLLVMAATFNRLWAYAARDYRLLDPKANRVRVDAITRQYRYGPHVYMVALLLDILNPYLSLALVILLAIMFALPSTVTQRGRRS